MRTRNDVSAFQIGLEAAVDQSWAAGWIYLRGLLLCLQAIPGPDRPEVRMLPRDAYGAGEAEALISNIPFARLALKTSSRAKGVNRHLAIRRIKRVAQCFLGRPLDPAFSGLDVTYPGWGRPIPGAAQMHWIPDFQYAFFPNLFPPSEVRALQEAHARIATRTGIVVLSSKTSLEHFESLYPKARATVRVWSFCSAITKQERVGPDPRELMRLPQTYLYVANQFWAHKDHLTLFQALHELHQEGLCLEVVCTGRLEDRRDPDYARRVQAFIQEHGLADHVRILGHIERSAQVQVMRHCAAVIQPSRFEGWGTVVEDAKACGRPVILSDIAVHKEQLPGGHFFEAGSSRALSDVLRQLAPSFCAGPDADAERRAEDLLSQRRRELGYEFLNICDDSVSMCRRNRS